jgi:hypothetical protein
MWRRMRIPPDFPIRYPAGMIALCILSKVLQNIAVVTGEDKR